MDGKKQLSQKMEVRLQDRCDFLCSLFMLPAQFFQRGEQPAIPAHIISTDDSVSEDTPSPRYAHSKRESIFVLVRQAHFYREGEYRRSRMLVGKYEHLARNGARAKQTSEVQSADS